MITDQLPKQIQEAMKARDTLRLTTLQMLKSALSYARIDKKSDLTDDEELAVVKAEAKKRVDAIDAYKKAGRDELVKKEQTELNVLEEYLPKQMPDEDLEKMVDKAIADTGASSMADMGKVIGVVISASQGAADGARVSALVKEKLT